MGHSTTTTRPEPMNASPHHPKVKVSVRLSDAHYVAGGSLGGRLELECKADKGLAIGVIRVELLAIEGLSNFLRLDRHPPSPYSERGAVRAQCLVSDFILTFACVQNSPPATTPQSRSSSTPHGSSRARTSRLPTPSSLTLCQASPRRPRITMPPGAGRRPSPSASRSRRPRRPPSTLAADSRASDTRFAPPSASPGAASAG